MPAPLPLGNDIVDLRLTDNRASAANRRYLERVLAAEERHALSGPENGPRAFWAYWAAKEAVYKALRKTDPELGFLHRRFVVYPDTPSMLDGGHGSARGVVIHRERRVPVTWNWTDGWVHCVTDNRPDQPRYRVCALADCRQDASFIRMKSANALTDASVAARVLALSLLSECGIADAQIVRPPAGRRPGPPRIAKDGVALDRIDVSLSHDGRYAAAAIRIDREAVSA